MDDFLTRAVFGVAGAAIGTGLLLFGRRYYWALFGVFVALLVTYFLTPILGLQDEVQLLFSGNWQAILVVLGAGLLGGVISRRRRDLTVIAIGFVAGVYIATFFDRILLYMSGRTDFALTWWLLLIFLLSGILAAYLTQRSPDNALILISVILGVAIISYSLNLSSESSLTAVITLSLALVGIVYQFATYMRDQPRVPRILPPVPAVGSSDLPYDLPNR